MSTLTLRRSTVFPILGGGTISLLLFSVLLSISLITVAPVPDANAINWKCWGLRAACIAAKAIAILACKTTGVDGAILCAGAKEFATEVCKKRDKACSGNSST